MPHDDKYEEILHKFLLADWQEYSTRENAERARSEVEQIMKAVWEKSGIQGEILLDIGGQSGEARIVDD